MTDEERTEQSEPRAQIPTVAEARKNGAKSAEKIKLTRNMFLVGGRPKMRVVELPEFGGALCKVCAMTGGQQEWVARQTSTEVDMEEAIARLKSDSVRAQVVAWCTLDYDTEQPLFSVEDVVEIMEKDAAVISRIFGVANSLSRVKDKEIDLIVEGFPKTPGGNFSTI